MLNKSLEQTDIELNKVNQQHSTLTAEVSRRLKLKHVLILILIFALTQTLTLTRTPTLTLTLTLTLRWRRSRRICSGRCSTRRRWRTR